MDPRIRKLMTMHKALHPRDDIDRLYVSRKEEGRGLASIEDSVDASIQRLEDYIEKHEGWLITAIRNDTDNRWTTGNFIREIESLLIAAQNNVIRTNHIKARIDKTQQNSKCRLCDDRDKIINHKISECSKLAQKEYNTRPRLGRQGDPLGDVQEI